VTVEEEKGRQQRSAALDFLAAAMEMGKEERMDALRSSTSDKD
jgi:hypothetical protein